MYTFEFEDGDEGEHWIQNWYSIYDPQGDFICRVGTKDSAEALLTHLNR